MRSQVEGLQLAGIVLEPSADVSLSTYAAVQLDNTTMIPNPILLEHEDVADMTANLSISSSLMAMCEGNKAHLSV